MQELKLWQLVVIYQGWGGVWVVQSASFLLVPGHRLTSTSEAVEEEPIRVSARVKGPSETVAALVGMRACALRAGSGGSRTTTAAQHQGVLVHPMGRNSTQGVES